MGFYNLTLLYIDIITNTHIKVSILYILYTVCIGIRCNFTVITTANRSCRAMYLEDLEVIK